MTTLVCWNCSQAIPYTPLDKIPFREQCDHCGSDLHCCHACRYYHRGMPNDCEVPGTDPIVYRERYNFCEEFRPNDSPPSSTKRVSKEEIEKRLFGEE